MEYLKLFENHSQYEDFIETEDFILPNVSHCIEQNEVHYNPIGPYNGHKYVDLGLPSGTKWAKMNVGANSEKEAGLYFAWGEITGYTASQVGTDKNFSWNDYALTQDSGSTMSKYNATDNKTHLELTDDAAAANMGGDWHMPNRVQCIELFKETKNGFVTNAGVFTEYVWIDNNGHSIPTETTATINNWDTAGYFFFKNTYASVIDAITAEDYLFVPTAGGCEGDGIYGVGFSGGVWASALNSVNIKDAQGFSFNSDGASVDDLGYRCRGQSVRGVVGKVPELKSHTWYEDHLEIVLSKPATNVTLIYQQLQGHDPEPVEHTLTSSDGITWTTSELAGDKHCADITVIANGITVGSWRETSYCRS